MSDAPLGMDFDTMNEADVREIIVRPLLHRLGYRHGTEANIRTEVSLRYGYAFLGRKKPGKDAELRGRADYICEVISYGRWVVEVKAPNEPLDRDTVEQAHSYSAHPDINASYFLISNGREFALYQTGSLDQPALAWAFADLEQNIFGLHNVVGPEAIRKRAAVLAVDPAKPLGKGVASRVTIVGGEVIFDEHATNTPLVPKHMIEGLRLPVTGAFVRRADDGRLHAFVKTASASPMMGLIGDMAGAQDEYDFFCADEYLSTDPKKPSIFQNLYKKHVAPGSLVSGPMGTQPMPFGFYLEAYTEAVGFVQGEYFRGTMRLEYDLTVEGLRGQVRAMLEQRTGPIPQRSQFSGMGRYEIRFA